MKDPDFQKAYEDQNRRDQIHYSMVATVLSIILNLSCSAMDYFVYGFKGLWWPFLKIRLCSCAVVALTWVWFKSPLGRNHHRIFGVMWYASPMIMILWMIYAAGDPLSPYYAGLNIILLAVGLLSPWTYRQNLISAILVLAMYVVVCSSMKTPQPISSIMNNTTFLVLTGAIVVAGSRFNARNRYREFELRWELDKNRRVIEENNRKLVELDQVKSRFFANISHELRTPLTLLLSPLETMIHSRNQQFDGPTRELLGIMQANGMRLLKLINDLLDLVRLESGRMAVKQEPLEIGAFLRGLVSAAQQMADAKGVKLETMVQSGIGIVLTDRDKLEKTILNLLFNALKFTPGGGSVTVRVEKQAEQLVISVEDTGVGIAEKNLPYVFDRFWQADDSSKRKFQGVGIGLSLVKELTEIQGGSVSVKSQIGTGTTFTVNLPFHQAEAVSPAPKPELKTVEPASPANDLPAASTQGSPNPQSEEWLANLYRRAELFPALTTGGKEAAKQLKAQANGGKPTLLVADDEPDMLRFLKSQLHSHYAVIEAVDGKQAVEKVTEFLPDIILLDMNMPEKDGLQVCRELRLQDSTRGIPIVVLTARADEETKLTALSAGANDFLCKPFSTSELHVRVRNLVEAHHYKEKLAAQNQTLEATIEQLKETETLLVQTEKMASLGRMSAGIMHEINNPLNYATTGIFTLQNKRKYVAPDQQAEYSEVLQEVEEGIIRVKNIVSDLNTFAHPDTEQLDDVNVTEIVASALRFLSNEWKDKVQIEQLLPADFSIRGNRNKLLQVFVNLFHNSLDAIRRKTFAEEKPCIRIAGREEGGSAIIFVRDNGEGIAAGTIGKVFDPFFTTKDVGEGIGLGLTICYRIVREYQGRISVGSEQGKYCEFKLEFPCENGKVADSGLEKTV